LKTYRHLMFGAAAVLAMLPGASLLAPERATPTSEIQRPTAVASFGNVERAVLATGPLQPSVTVEVQALISGRVSEIMVGPGDAVRQGDVIARLDSDALRLDIRQQRLNVTQAEAQLRDAVSQLTLAQANASRQKVLFDRGIISKQVWDQQTSNLSNRQSTADSQRQRLDSQKKVLEQRTRDLELTEIRAPIDGVVSEVLTHPGDRIDIDGPMPSILRIVRMNVLTVRAEMSRADVRKVRPGQKAYFVFTSDPGKRHYATLLSSEPALTGGAQGETGGAKDQTAYYDVVLDVPQPVEGLVPAAIAEVHLVLDEADNVLTVPAGALAANKVEVVQPDGSVQAREVRVGVRNGVLAEIRDGLAPGERVIVDGADLPGSL